MDEMITINDASVEPVGEAVANGLCESASTSGSLGALTIAAIAIGAVAAGYAIWRFVGKPIVRRIRRKKASANDTIIEAEVVED